jgi:hypothetical protein
MTILFDPLACSKAIGWAGIVNCAPLVDQFFDGDVRTEPNEISSSDVGMNQFTVFLFPLDENCSIIPILSVEVECVFSGQADRKVQQGRRGREESALTTSSSQ